MLRELKTLEAGKQTSDIEEQSFYKMIGTYSAF